MKICTCQKISVHVFDCPLHGEMLRQEEQKREDAKHAASHANRGGNNA